MNLRLVLDLMLKMDEIIVGGFMQENRLLRSTMAISLAVIILCSVISFPSKALTITLPAREVNLLIVYDESYEAFFRDLGITDVESRLRQMVYMAEIPFRNTWNISFNCTILPYEDTLGDEYACQTCPGLWSWENNEPNTTRVWKHLTGQCRCNVPACYTSLSVPGHHNSAHRTLDIAAVYANSHSATYNAVGVFTGHQICYGGVNAHGPVGGLAYPGGNAFISAGYYNVYAYDHESQSWVTTDSTPNLLNNIMSNIAIMQHEISHNYGLGDTNHDFSDENDCNENMPCIMSGSFDGIVYIENIWCEHCRSKFAYSSKGHLLGGE